MGFGIEEMHYLTLKGYVNGVAIYESLALFIIERYGGRIGENKARAILQAVRHCCNGGKLKSSSLVLRSELEYWESLVDKKFLARL